MFRGKPIVGVMPLWDEKRQSYWMLPGYIRLLEEQGAIPLIPPLTAEKGELDYFLDSCDGFLLTGGQDVEPAVYHREKTHLCGETAPLRDQMDQIILQGAVELDKAVLGICRGLQLMNSVYGGTLYQDLPTEHPSPISHRMQPPYDQAAHSVLFPAGTPLAQLLGTEQCGVNSCHHQGIQTLSPSFSPMAQAEDGLIEGIFMPHKTFVWGVQWHPEFSYLVRPESRAIVLAFVQAASRE